MMLLPAIPDRNNVPPPKPSTAPPTGASGHSAPLHGDATGLRLAGASGEGDAATPAVLRYLIRRGRQPGAAVAGGDVGVVAYYVRHAGRTLRDVIGG
ncbi:MAG: hypothetical protein ACE5E6_01430 [Phycisphaerae bacterium]